MPASKKCIYQDMAGNTSVTLFNVGTGYVVYLGYEFNKAGPGCPQPANAWTGCIVESAVDVATFGPTGVPAAPIPTLSEWGTMILILLLLTAGIIKYRQSIAFDGNIGLF